MKVQLKKRSIEIPVKKVSEIGKYSGLMFRTRNIENLLFDFSRPGDYGIHSFFVFFDFLAIWLDDKNEVVDWKIVNPFTPLVKPKKDFVRLIEVPLSSRNSAIIRFFDGDGKV